jgi:hypothetical protein
LEDKEDEKNKKHYNLRKIKVRAVYVSSSKIFQLDNLRDTDHVIKAMKRGYKGSIEGSFFAGSGQGAQMGQQDGTGNQQKTQTQMTTKGSHNQNRTRTHNRNNKNRQGWMLTNLARYNAPGIKDNKNITGKRNQRDRHQMADECEKKRDRIAKSDMQHREKQQRMMENIRAEIFTKQQEATSINTTAPTSSKTASQASSRATSPITSI